jgi:hypothetical protein
MNRVACLLLIAMFAAHFGCASRSEPLNHRPTSSSSTTPSASPPSSGDVAAALIPFEQPKTPFTIDSLLTELQKRLPYKCSRTQWVGLTTTIPQIRIDAPTPIFLQIDDDPETVPDESKELASDAKKTFGPDIAAKIAGCRVRLEVMGPDIGEVSVKDKSINVTAATQLDPSVAPAKDVLKIVADTVHGFVYDAVHGNWQYAAQ